MEENCPKIIDNNKQGLLFDENKKFLNGIDLHFESKESFIMDNQKSLDLSNVS